MFDNILINKKLTPSNKFIIVFIIKAIVLYVVWYCVYDLWLKKVGVLDVKIIDSIVYFTVETLDFFNYILYVDYHKVGIHGSYASVIVAKGCNGVELFALFSGFVLAFEGGWKHKIWFIPLGIIIIHFLNVLRIISLVFMGTISLSALEFNHKYTFTIIMYIITFLGWMIWVKYFATKRAINEQEKAK